MTKNQAPSAVLGVGNRLTKFRKCNLLPVYETPSYL